MIPINFNQSISDGLKVLVVGAHCDDIEIGCGGTLLKMIEQNLIKEIKWVVFASNEIRRKEAMQAAENLLAEIDNKEVIILDYQDSFLDKFRFQIKEQFEELKSFDPDLVFTHYRDDRHQDHRLLSDLAWNTFRNHLILEYEIPKYDGDLGKPNFYVDLNERIAQRKTDIILQSYHSQSEKHWFDQNLFESLMRIRGMESGNLDRFSEAFYARKIVYK